MFIETTIDKLEKLVFNSTCNVQSKICLNMFKSKAILSI